MRDIKSKNSKTKEKREKKKNKKNSTVEVQSIQYSKTMHCGRSLKLHSIVLFHVRFEDQLV